jgi:hypothetical protein
MHRIVGQLLSELTAAELLELEPGATLEELEEEILEAMAHAPGFSQATPFLANQIVASDKVLELYASDDQVREIMKSMEV